MRTRCYRTGLPAAENAAIRYQDAHRCKVAQMHACWWPALGGIPALHEFTDERAGDV